MNCIFWENSASSGKDIHNYCVSDTLFVYSSDIDYNLISGQWFGEYNFLADPMFTDTLCHLDCWSFSPCINTGIPELVIGTDTFLAPPHDFDGEVRPQDDYYDIGAMEESICVSVEENFPPISNPLIRVYPNPASNHFSIDILQGVEITILEIINIQGKVSLHQKVTNGNYSFDVSHLPKGLYFIRIYTSEGPEVKKLIIQ